MLDFHMNYAERKRIKVIDTKIILSAPEKLENVVMKVNGFSSVTMLRGMYNNDVVN